jgi:hypothetical protein
VNEPAAAALFLGLLFGRPLPRTTAAGERLSSVQALPILASDALSSAAYATEAALEAWRSAATVSDQVMAVHRALDASGNRVFTLVRYDLLA